MALEPTKFCKSTGYLKTDIDISSNARQPVDGNQDTAASLLFKENELCII